jgi:hypothetical protein
MATPLDRTVTDLLRALERGEVESARAILDGQVDFGGLVTLVEKHRLAGYLYALVKDGDLAPLLQRKGFADLHAGYVKQCARAERNVRLAGEMSRRFEQAAIPYLTLKGLYQAQRFYGDIRNRFMWDLDILVRPPDLPAVIEQVQNIGLNACSALNFDARRGFWGIHAVEFRGEPGKVDIHVALRNLPGVHLDYRDVWGNAQTFEVEGLILPTLSDEHTLLTATLGMGADIQRGKSNLRKIWDMYLMLEALDSSQDWEVFFSRREEEGSLKLVMNVFSFVGYLLGVMQDWPGLATAMNRKRDMLLIRDQDDARTVFTRRPGHFGNRVFYSRILDVSPIKYWSHWLVTSPARYLHYQGTGK